MVKKPLQTLFHAMYHGKHDYRDFIAGSIKDKYRAESIGDPTKGKKRAIYVPDKTLKIYHGFLNLFLFDYLRVNERVVFSYRKKVNAANAVALHAASKHFYQADIQDFFPSIDSNLIIGALRECADRCPIEDLEENLSRIVEMITIENALPLGFSTSPVISNSVLYQFDNLLEEYCVAHDLIYTRYSDDVIISSRVRELILDLDQVVTDTLQKAGLGRLSLNATKTKITSVGRKIKLLGMVILPNGRISVDSKFKNQVETLLHLYVKNPAGFREVAGQDIAKSTEKLSGYLNYINTVDGAYLDKLRKKYGITVVDVLIHQSKK